VIVREKPDSYLLVRQYDHSLLSGEFAWHLSERPQPIEPALLAIREHDVGWQMLDQTVRWDGETGEPYSFTSYPIEPKLRAYEEGLDLLEARSPYAACLCSMHYGGLAGDSGAEVRFKESEAGRRRRIESKMTEEEKENLERNLQLLRLCDDLSLFVCLNEPGRNDHPWYRDGIGYREITLKPTWKDCRTLEFDPNPFSEPFGLAVPYTLIGTDGQDLGTSHLRLWVTC
jgi:hypothetical protein